MADSFHGCFYADCGCLSTLYCRDCASDSVVSLDVFVRLAVMALSLDFPAMTCDDLVLLRSGAFPVNNLYKRSKPDCGVRRIDSRPLLAH